MGGVWVDGDHFVARGAQFTKDGIGRLVGIARDSGDGDAGAGTEEVRDRWGERHAGMRCTWGSTGERECERAGFRRRWKISEAQMSRIEQLEQQIAELDEAELKALREWFARFDAEVWDRQIEADAKNGKLASLAERALQDHAAGRSTKL